MANITDNEMMLQALRKERDIVHDRLMQIDRIMKKIKSGKYNSDEDAGIEGTMVNAVQSTNAAIPLIDFPKNADIKVQIIRVINELGKASKLSDIQAAYTKHNGSYYNIREPLRSMQRNKLLRIIKEKDSKRGFLWVKSEWVIDDQLLDDYKPEGFDILYRSDNLIYE